MPLVGWSDDVLRAAEAAGLERKELGSFEMRVTLNPFDGVSEPRPDRARRCHRRRVRQLIIDAYGGHGPTVGGSALYVCEGQSRPGG